MLRSPHSLRYRDMKYDGIENDLYNYHLQYLVKQGLVAKERGYYNLSDYGKKFIADISPLDPLGKQADKFKMNVLLVVINKIDDRNVKILNQERGRHPFYGEVGVMGGTIRKGELVLEAAARKLKEETGLSGMFKLCGFNRSIYYEQDKLFTDILFQICIADQFVGDLVNTEFGLNYWVDIEQAFQNEFNSKTPVKGVVELLMSIKEGRKIEGVFYYEEKYQISSY